MGVPAIVSDYAQFADLPHEVALRVPLGDDEVDALAAMLRDLLARPERLRAMGEAARELVRSRHDPARARPRRCSRRRRSGASCRPPPRPSPREAERAPPPIPRNPPKTHVPLSHSAGGGPGERGFPPPPA